MRLHFKLSRVVVFMITAAIIYTSALAKDAEKKIIFCDYHGSDKTHQIMLDNIGVLYRNGFKNLLIESEENDIESVESLLKQYFTLVAQAPIKPEHREFTQGFLGNIDSLLRLIQTSKEIGFDVQGMGVKPGDVARSFREAAIINKNAKEGKKVLAIIGTGHCKDIISHKITDFDNTKFIVSETSCSEEKAHFSTANTSCDAYKKGNTSANVCFHSENNNCFSDYVHYDSIKNEGVNHNEL